MSSDDAALEIEHGRRFAFGDNWASFLAELDETRVAAATESLRTMLGVTDLSGRRFLDIGSGSGLFSLAARRLGADVVSFDDDPASVACTEELRRATSAEDPAWNVLNGSVLDRTFLAQLGRYDIVYAWGVLHHTGDMWSAAENVGQLVLPGGHLFVSIYNDQGFASRLWWHVKKSYCAAGPLKRRSIVLAADLYFSFGRELRRLPAAGYRAATRRRTPKGVSRERRPRGMDRRHDLIDWVGGFPFEVAKPEQVFDFFRQRGFDLEALTTCGGGLGCNQFVFRRREPMSES